MTFADQLNYFEDFKARVTNLRSRDDFLELYSELETAKTVVASIRDIIENDPTDDQLRNIKAVLRSENYL